LLIRPMLKGSGKESYAPANEGIDSLWNIQDAYVQITIGNGK
jgi:hypothetical protein